MKKAQRVIKFNEKTWLKPNFDINERQNLKNYSEKDFFKWLNNAVFGKTIEKVRKHWNTKLVTAEMGRNYLVSGPNYDTNSFTNDLLPI